MRVLFIGKRHYTNRDAFNECFGRIYQLPWHWAQAGIQVRLWLIDYHLREISRRQDGTLEVISTPVLSWASLGRVVSEVFRKRQASRDGEVVVASGDCYVGALAYWLSKRMRARFVFDVYDKYDEFGGYRRLPGFDLFSFLLRRSNRLIFASRSLMQQLGIAGERAILVPNGVDVGRFRALDMNACRRALGLPQRQTLIGYFGSMESDRGVDDLITAVRLLRDNGMSIELLLGGKLRAGLDVQQPGVRYIGNVPFDRMPAALASCDLLAVPYRRSAFMDAGASNKIAEALACGRPIVATRTPNFVANFPDQAVQLDGLLAEPNDAADLARVIRLQSAHKVVLDMPAGMDWRTIAATAAAQLFINDARARETSRDPVT